jgi:tetratricopeptide (TPR) repeat protein
MMNWGTTSLVLNPNVVRRLVLGLILSSSWSAPGILPVHSAWAAPASSAASQLGEARTRRYSDADAAAVQSADEKEVEKIRNQEIRQIRTALGMRLPQNRRADLYYRLAEIYLEAYRAEFLLEGRIHDQRRSEESGNPFIFRGRSLGYLKSGIQACQDIVALRIPFEKLDRVYYFLGVNFEELDQRAESLKYFNQLTQKFPGSPFVAEAYRELGDDSFEQKQFGKAQAYYEMAVERSKERKADPNYPRLLHKLAWAYYRTRQFDRAISTMKESVELSQAGGEKLVSLREEALRDMAIFMTETGRVDDALNYFKKVAGDRQYYPKTLERLGKQYERNTETTKATQVYETLLKMYPNDDASFRVLVKLVDLDLRRGRRTEALARLEGARIPKSGDQETQIALQNLRAMVRRTATEAHEKYRRDSSRVDLTTADSFYSSYLNRFLAQSDPKKESPEIQMYLAEVKRELGQSDEASQLYRKVLDSGDTRYAKEAGALWTASLSEAIKKAPPNLGEKSTEPSKLERDFIDAADEMQDSLSELPEGQEAALKAAQVLAGYPKTQGDAIKRARKLVEKSPRSPQAVTAARLWVQLLSDRLPDPKAKAELSELVTDFRANTALMAADAEASSKLKSQLHEVDQGIRVGAIATAEKEKDFKKAALGYEQFALESKNRDAGEKAFASAVAAYVKAGDFDGADGVLSQWSKRYPDSKRAQDSMRSAATLALIQGRFDRAADMFTRLGKSGRNPESLETAARILQGTGDITRARGLWNLYLAVYPKGGSRGPVHLLLAQSAESDSDLEGAEKNYRACVQLGGDLSSECGARLGDLLIKTKNDRAGAKKAFEAVGSQKGKGLSPYVGYARYRLAEMMETEASFETLSLPESQLKKAVDQRMAFLEPLTKAYQSVVETGGPWGVAALDRLANWVLRFTNDLEGIAPPEGASAKTLEQFQKGISSIAEPLRRKSIETWLKAYQNALAGDVLSTSVPFLADRLSDARLETKKVEYPYRAQGYRGRLRLAGVAADGADVGRITSLERVRERLTKNSEEASAWVDYGNLLWGEGKPLLARIAYERSLVLDPKSASALNNRAVILISGNGQEDWARVAEADALLKKALEKDSGYIPALMNRGALLNYYRLFAKARPVFEGLSTRVNNSDVWDGLAIAAQGLGQMGMSEGAFAKANELGASPKRFSLAYHQAASAVAETAGGAQRCLTRLGEVDESQVSGFEKESLDSLKRMCRRWKND